MEGNLIQQANLHSKSEENANGLLNQINTTEENNNLVSNNLNNSNSQQNMALNDETREDNIVKNEHISNNIDSNRGNNDIIENNFGRNNIHTHEQNTDNNGVDTLGNNIEDNDQYNNEDFINEINNSKERKKRRSKNDLDGRSNKCKHCEKTYLSEIALNNHVKNKHSHLVEIVSRGRGRPRKAPNSEMSSHIPPVNDLKFKQFFETQIRGKNDMEFDLIKTSKEHFENIYNKYKDKLFKEITNLDDFSFINCPENEFCDYAFWKYVEFCYEKTNKEYFEFIFKFVILFRECINQKREEGYTKVNNAEIVPDMCNEFVSEFMEAYDYFGLDVTELIEVIQHCCHWLWENHFTSSRLTLVNS
jgi:hypothetical protein